MLAELAPLKELIDLAISVSPLPILLLKFSRQEVLVLIGLQLDVAFIDDVLEVVQELLLLDAREV